MNLSNLKIKKQTIRLEFMTEIKQELNDSNESGTAEIIQLKKRILELEDQLRMNEFDDVRVVLRNDKHLYIENKKKIKIRPVDTARKKNKN